MKSWIGWGEILDQVVVETFLAFITPAGRERLREMRESLLGLWEGIAAELDGVS